MSNIGLQLYSIRDEVEKDLLGTLEKVAEMGYTGAQFAGFGNNKAEDVKAKMDEVGIVAAGAHVQIDALLNDLEATLTYHETIGNELIIIPFLGDDMRTTEDDYKRTAELLRDLGKTLHARGFTLGYHNHDFEFDVFGDKTGLDIIFENTDAEHLKLELDCFWGAYTDNDPLQVIDKFSNRVVSLHIKDMKVDGDQRISTELGTGTLPLATYMQKGIDIGAKWLIVEQEHFPKDPLVIAAENAVAIKQFNEKLNR